MERAEVRKYLAQIENLIKNAGLEGIHFEGISATYGDSDLSVKIKFNTVSEDGTVNHDREEAYLSYVFGNLGKKNLPKKFIGAKVKVRDAFGDVNRSYIYNFRRKAKGPKEFSNHYKYFRKEICNCSPES